MTTDRDVLSTLLAERILLQLPCGGWAAAASWTTLVLNSSIRLGKPYKLRLVLLRWVRSVNIFVQVGCGCNFGCTLPHIDNVSSIYR
jgi:hypothetical protein